MKETETGLAESASKQRNFRVFASPTSFIIFFGVKFKSDSEPMKKES